MRLTRLIQRTQKAEPLISDVGKRPVWRVVGGKMPFQSFHWIGEAAILVGDITLILERKNKPNQFFITTLLKINALFL
jgi:hypothetical protein